MQIWHVPTTTTFSSSSRPTKCHLLHHLSIHLYACSRCYPLRHPATNVKYPTEKSRNGSIAGEGVRGEGVRGEGARAEDLEVECTRTLA